MKPLYQEEIVICDSQQDQWVGLKLEPPCDSCPCLSLE